MFVLPSSSLYDTSDCYIIVYDQSTEIGGISRHMSFEVVNHIFTKKKASGCFRGQSVWVGLGVGQG